MSRRDPMFWMASAIVLVSLVLGQVFDNGYLLLLVAAYLLRPTLHSVGFFPALADERELAIQHRASSVGFFAMVVGVVVVMLVLMARDDHTWEMLVAVLMVALAARALAGLLMTGNPAATGRRILFGVGALLATFGLLEGGLSLESAQHTLPGAVLVGLAFAAKQFRRPVGYVTLAISLGAGVFLGTAMVRSGRMGWGGILGALLLVVPLVVAAAALLRASAASDDSGSASGTRTPDAPTPNAPTPGASTSGASAPGASTPGASTPGALLVVVTALFTGVLTANAVAQTLPLDCRPWGKNASAKLCTLAHDDTVKGRRMPAGTLLRYDSTGMLNFVWFTRKTSFEGYDVQGGRDGPHHDLYPDGSPRRIWLSRTQDVQGVPCRPISFWTEIIGHTSAVYFYPSGRLRACRLGRPATIQGNELGKGARVEFDSAGRVVR